MYLYPLDVTFHLPDVPACICVYADMMCIIYVQYAICRAVSGTLDPVRQPYHWICRPGYMVYGVPSDAPPYLYPSLQDPVQSALWDVGARVIWCQSGTVGPLSSILRTICIP